MTFLFLKNKTGGRKKKMAAKGHVTAVKSIWKELQD